jgi:hypothetical protein
MGPGRGSAHRARIAVAPPAMLAEAAAQERVGRACLVVLQCPSRRVRATNVWWARRASTLGRRGRSERPSLSLQLVPWAAAAAAIFGLTRGARPGAG